MRGPGLINPRGGVMADVATVKAVGAVLRGMNPDGINALLTIR
jgi:chemotaxis response regulator CheB